MAALYERFLLDDDSLEERVLPYTGGMYVDGLRIIADPPARVGFWLFAVTGRRCRPLNHTDAPPLEDKPSVLGHICGEYLVSAGANPERLAWVPDDVPPRFSPIRCRRWSPSTLILDQVEWETEAEEIVRRRYEERRTLDGVRGVPATLRAAWAYAVAERYGREHDLPIVPAEVRLLVGRIVESGESAISAHVERLRADRARAAAARRVATEANRLIDAEFAAHVARAEHDRNDATEPDDWAVRRNNRSGPTQSRRNRSGARGSGNRGDDPLEAATDALHKAGADVLDARPTGGLIEVRFRFMGERFITMARADTLQVVDAGICLAGADREITLDSLPSVIREAVEEDVLVITRFT